MLLRVGLRVELLAQQYIAGLNGCFEEILQQDVVRIVDVVFDAYCRGKHVFVMGNGGSATIASHFARDLRIGAAVEGKPRIQANSITDSIAIITVADGLPENQRIGTLHYSG